MIKTILLIFIVLIIIIITIIFNKKIKKPNKTEEPLKQKEFISKKGIKFTWPKKPIRSKPIKKITKKDNRFNEILKELSKKNQIEYNLENKQTNEKKIKKPIIQEKNTHIKEKTINKKQNKKRLYYLFFRKAESQETINTLKEHKLNLYKIGEIKFSIIKSSKDPKELIKLAKIISNKTKESDILLHSLKLEESKNLSSYFKPFKEVLITRPGITITNKIYLLTQEKKDFSFLKEINNKNELIRFYHLNKKE